MGRCNGLYCTVASMRPPQNAGESAQLKLVARIAVALQ